MFCIASTEVLEHLIILVFMEFTLFNMSMYCDVLKQRNNWRLTGCVCLYNLIQNNIKTQKTEQRMTKLNHSSILSYGSHDTCFWFTRLAFGLVNRTTGVSVPVPDFFK